MPCYPGSKYFISRGGGGARNRASGGNVTQNRSGNHSTAKREMYEVEMQTGVMPLISVFMKIDKFAFYHKENQRLKQKMGRYMGNGNGIREEEAVPSES